MPESKNSQRLTKPEKPRKTKKYKSTLYLPRQYLNNPRIKRVCLLLDKTDYQIPGTLEFGNLFWPFATFKNTAGRSEVLPGATKKENQESTLNDFTQLLLALHKML